MLLLALLFQIATGSPAKGRVDSSFAATVAALSEPGGMFFSDNLVSNETSFLHIVPALERLRVHGGAYLGVGPEQNFSYIARTRPSVAFLIDIRRDNLLLHLFLKAIFERADTRLEYLCLLYARRCPDNLDAWRRRPVVDLLGYIDRQPLDTAWRRESETDLLAVVWTFGVPVTGAEFETIRRLHDEFVTQGLDLQFSAYGRRATFSFPTVRQLYQEKDLTGRFRSFLADEAGYEVVRRLHRRDRIVPVVGDLGGDYALKAIGRWLAQRGERLSLFYLSNVEFYLFRSGTFGRFVENVRALPAGPRSFLTRSYFAVQTGMSHPDERPGDLSVPILQRLDRFLAQAGRSDLTYWQLMTEANEALAR